MRYGFLETITNINSKIFNIYFYGNANITPGIGHHALLMISVMFGLAWLAIMVHVWVSLVSYHGSCLGYPG